MIFPIAGLIEAETAICLRQALARARRNESITIILHRCSGGDLDAAMEIASLLRAHHGPTSARVSGFANSAGLQILAACKERRATERATFALHATALRRSVLAGGRLTGRRLHEAAVQLDLSDRQARVALAADIRCSIGQLAALEERGAKMSAGAALRLGLLTEIIGQPARAARPAAMVWSASQSRLVFGPEVWAKITRYLRAGGQIPALGMSSGAFAKLVMRQR